MTERSGTDDDKAADPAEVTVPPWLRSGPTADQPAPTPQPVTGPAPGTDDAESERADAGAPEDPPATAPTRITLGAQPRTAATGGPAGPGGAAPDDPPAVEHREPGREVTDEGRVDDLSKLPLRAATRTPDVPGAQQEDAAGGTDVALRESAPEVRGDAGDGAASTPFPARRPVRIAVAVAAGTAVLGGSAVLGFVVARGASGPGPEPVAAAATPGCEDLVADGRVTGSGPGSLDSPAGAVLAFDHAYYVDRSAEKAFEAVASSSRMTEEQLRAEGIDLLAEGTTHCVQVSEIAPTLLDVELTEFPPGADPVLIRQRIRVEERPDGTWGIVSITPAG